MNKNHCKQENIRLGTHGEDYGSWMSNPVFYIIGGIMEQVHRVVLSHLDYDGEGKILEVGCGSGALTIRSALTWPKAKVIGVDHWGAVYNYSKHSARRMLPGRAWLPAVYFSTVMRSSWIFLMRVLM